MTGMDQIEAAIGETNLQPAPTSAKKPATGSKPKALPNKPAHKEGEEWEEF